MSQGECVMARQLAQSSWTRRLQILVGVCSLVFFIGTTLHNFAVVDIALVETMMREAGGDNPAGDATGFTIGFRIVGCLYIVGNALGILALWSRATWLFWVVLIVNLTQGLGYFMIPPEMWTAAQHRYGIPGLLPSLITDGGAALLAIVLIISLVIYRTPWAQLHSAAPAGTHLP